MSKDNQTQTSEKNASKPKQKGTKGQFVANHKRLKNIFSNNEAKALKDVLTKTNLHPKQLVADHTDTTFVWKQKA